MNAQLFVHSDNIPAGRFTVDLNSGDSRRFPGTESALSMSKSADGNLWTEWRMKANELNIKWVSLQKITPEGVPVGPLFQAKNKDSGFIWSMLEVGPQCVLLGLGTGLMVLNPTTGAFVIPPNAAFPEFDHARVNSLQRDRSGQIWACTSPERRRRHHGSLLAGRTRKLSFAYENIFICMTMPTEYVDEARFQKARLLLETRAVSSVKAAAYSVGLKQVEHFSLNYKKRFGKSPSEEHA